MFREYVYYKIHCFESSVTCNLELITVTFVRGIPFLIKFNYDYDWRDCHANEKYRRPSVGLINMNSRLSTASVFSVAIGKDVSESPSQR